MPEDSRTHKEPPAAKARRYLRDPVWQSAGVVVAIIGVLLSLPIACSEKSNREPVVAVPKSSASPSPASATPSPTNTEPAGVTCIQGDGDNNTNNCGNKNVLPPEPTGQIKPTFDFVMWAWLDGKNGSPPKPTGGEIQSSECDDWGSWLADTPGVHVVDPRIQLGIEGNSTSNLVVSNIYVDLFRRTKIQEGSGTLIKCMFGGGSHSSYEVTIDTVHRKTLVAELDTGTVLEKYEMPPGSIVLSGGGYAGVRIRLSSLPDYMYEGAITIVGSINGKPAEFKIGSRESPLRWATPTRVEDEEPEFIGWNGDAQKWSRKYYPF